MKKLLLPTTTAALLCLFGSRLNAPAQSNVGLQNRFHAFASANSSVLTNSQTKTVNSESVPVYRDRGMGFFATFFGTNATAATVTFKFDVTYDGTNWTTIQPFVWGATLNSTNPVVAYTNLPSTALDNARGIRLASIQNSHTNSIIVSNVVATVFP